LCSICLEVINGKGVGGLVSKLERASIASAVGTQGSLLLVQLLRLVQLRVVMGAPMVLKWLLAHLSKTLTLWGPHLNKQKKKN
jgi:hypothetical protein